MRIAGIRLKELFSEASRGYDCGRLRTIDISLVTPFLAIMVGVGANLSEGEGNATPRPT